MFIQMRIRDNLEAISDQTMLGYAIKLQLFNKFPLGDIIATIKKAYQEYPSDVLHVVGEDTIRLINNLHCKN